MNLVVATAPAIEPLTLSETLLHLRVDIVEDNDLVIGLISAAREYCEAAARRTFINTTFDLYLDAWPLYGQFELPNPPLVSVTGVYYTDENGDEAEFSSANYIVDSSSEPGRVRKKSTASWPTTTLQGSHSMCASDSRVRLRVISTKPNWEKPPAMVLTRSRASCFVNSVRTACWWSSRTMSMKSTMMIPPRLRRRS